MPVITLQELIDAGADVATLEAVVNGGASPGTVTTRLGTALKTLARLELEAQGQLSYAVLANVAALRLYSRPSGVSAVLLRGLTSQFDGTGAFMLHDPDSAAADDGVDTVVGADGARWRRLSTTSHGPIEVPLVLSTRITVQGTWTIGASDTLSSTDITGSARLKLPVSTGARLTSLRVRGKGTIANDLFTACLHEGSGTSNTTTQVGSLVTSSGTAEQDLVVPLNVTVAADKRYFLQIATAGGGVNSRIITGAFFTSQRV